MEAAMEKAHPDYRLFISAEPAAAAGNSIIFILILIHNSFFRVSHHTTRNSRICD